ncbi:MAG TPA: hypothetical protein GXX59_01710 [Syntrophomonadaceae bacterium]|nr:hypothetical protein [Syntrophomonadaceae bacterium]
MKKLFFTRGAFKHRGPAWGSMRKAVWRCCDKGGTTPPELFSERNPQRRNKELSLKLILLENGNIEVSI